MPRPLTDVLLDAAQEPAPGIESRGRLTVHVVAYALLLLALTPLLRLDTSFTADEGGIALQVQTLVDTGRWASEHPSAELDDGEFFAYKPGAQRSGDDWFIFAKHPLHIEVVALLSRFLSLTAAMYVLPMAGATLAAASAWHLARELGSVRPDLAFWLVALSPVLFFAFVPLGHTIAAGLVGTACVALSRAHRFSTARHLVAAVAALCLAVAFRREVLLFCVALAIVAAVGYALRREYVRGVLISSSLSIPPLLTWVAEVRVARHIVGQGAGVSLAGLTEETDTPYLTSRSTSLANDLIRSSADWAEPRTVIAIGLSMMIVIAALLMRRQQPATWLAAVSLLVFAGMYALWSTLLEPRHFTGLIVAWPVAILWLAQARIAPQRITARYLASTCLLFAVFVYLLQYEVGGSGGWGPRYLLPVAVPTCALIAYGLKRHLGSQGAGEGPGVRVCLWLIVILPAVASLIALTGVRDREATLISSITLNAPEAVISVPESLPRQAWREAETTEWYQTEPDRVSDLVRRLQRRGLSRITLVGTRRDLATVAIDLGTLHDPRFDPWHGLAIVDLDQTQPSQG